MPKTKTTAPIPTRERGQKSLDLPLYLNRILPQWTQPSWLEGDVWRKVVERQPIATAFREQMISMYLALDWKIEPRESKMRDELKDEMKYYTNFFTQTGDYDYTEMVEWIGRDLLDLPFGAAGEIGRSQENAKVFWIELLDGTTLFPTLNKDWPVGQTLREMAIDTVYFPSYTINRVYMSPRTEILRKGWGMPPPEKIYLALTLIGRGDIYYANLLLDTPAAGILDLGDMASDSAIEWVKGWREMLTGIDSFKIPVLYEHEKDAKWIPFTKNPAELLYNETIQKYAAIVGAGYGMSLSDIGFPSSSNGGDTLAGSIRAERHTNKTGFARFKKKLVYWFNRILPDYLEYKLIDQDDELMTNIGRSRLANATALGLLIDKKVVSPQESRLQLIADGLITISIPEEVPDESEFPAPPVVGGNNFGNDKTSERPSMLGKPINPSQGGYGEIRSEAIDKALETDPVFKSMFDTVYSNWDDMSDIDREKELLKLETYLAVNYADLEYNDEEKLDV